MELAVREDTFRLAETFTISRGSRTEAKVLTVELGDAVHRGLGECVPYARYGESLSSVTEQIQSVAADLRNDPAPVDLLELMPAGAARNAVDCALWDLQAKRKGKPVWQLLEMSAPEAVTTVYTLSLAEPEAMRQKAIEHSARPVLKLKLGGEGDVERLRAVREGAPDTQIVVDANEGWTAETYQTLAPVLLELGVTMVEQPLPAGED
ncbi:MAG: dipeptide epimerase, partial [Gammaproteobacteria bacterium]|nr:dipeptide epimerase [Gammaproteobacteria bacterium]